MVCHVYTREDLLAVRETLSLEMFPDPVPPNCPMRTDSEILLLQTTVRKREKVKIAPLRQTTRAFDGLEGAGDEMGRFSLSREAFGKHVVAEEESKKAEKKADLDKLRKNVIMPPRLDIPFVTIGRRKRGGVSTSGDKRTDVEVNVDTERSLVARLRLHQRQQRPSNSSAPLPRDGDAYGGVVVSSTSALSGPGTVLRRSLVDERASPRPGEHALPQRGVDSAVPIANVSLFNSATGSRYFQFTRVVGLLSYLFSTLGTCYPQFLSHLAVPLPCATDANSSSSTSGSCGQQFSIGQDTPNTTPVERGASEGELTGKTRKSDATETKKKPHRRRTNRTHAEKREHRRSQQLLLQQAPVLGVKECEKQDGQQTQPSES